MPDRTANCSRRHHCALAAILFCFPLPGLAGCWEIARTSGETVVTSDIWQIRNRISGENALVGETGDERQAVSLARVNSLTMVESTESGWLSGDGNAVAIEIRLTDDQTIALVSDMNLYYLVDDKRHAVKLADVVSVNRCTDDAAAALPVTAVPPALEAASLEQTTSVLVMKNGDMLYGEVAADQLRWQTSYASIEFEPDQLKSIVASCEASDNGVLETLAGDQLNGHFGDSSVSFRLTTGQPIEIPTEQIELIDFIGTQAADRMATEGCKNDH
jgi:hypothetical protein